MPYEKLDKYREIFPHGAVDLYETDIDFWDIPADGDAYHPRRKYSKIFDLSNRSLPFWNMARSDGYDEQPTAVVSSELLIDIIISEQPGNGYLENTIMGSLSASRWTSYEKFDYGNWYPDVHPPVRRLIDGKRTKKIIRRPRRSKKPVVNLRFYIPTFYTPREVPVPLYRIPMQGGYNDNALETAIEKAEQTHRAVLANLQKDFDSCG